MYSQEHEYTDAEFENYEFETQDEFELEDEYTYEKEMEGSYEFEDEYNDEMELDNEFEEEYAFEYDNEFETEDENIAYEDEVRVHDDRTRRHGSPANRRSYSRPGKVVTVPARQGASANRFPFQRPTNPYASWNNRYRRPAWDNRPPVRRQPFLNRYNWRNRLVNNSYQPSYVSPYPGAVAQPVSDNPIQTDTGLQNHILETLKSISAQLAASNASIQALQNPSPNNTPPEMGNTESQPPQQAGNESEFEFENEFDGEVYDSEGSFSETREMELASELLSLNNEAELEYFIGSLINNAAGIVRGIAKSSQGKLLKKLIRNVAKKSLPILGSAVGTFAGGPMGAQMGLSAGSAAAKMFELEFDGLSNEDREFETARAVVRLAGNASRQLTDIDSGDPQEDARQALIKASMLYAPGLIVSKNGNRRIENGHFSGRY